MKPIPTVNKRSISVPKVKDAPAPAKAEDKKATKPTTAEKPKAKEAPAKAKTSEVRPKGKVGRPSRSKSEPKLAKKSDKAIAKPAAKPIAKPAKKAPAPTKPEKKVEVVAQLKKSASTELKPKDKGRSKSEGKVKV